MYIYYAYIYIYIYIYRICIYIYIYICIYTYGQTFCLASALNVSYKCWEILNLFHQCTRLIQNVLNVLKTLIQRKVSKEIIKPCVAETAKLLPVLSEGQPEGLPVYIYIHIYIHIIIICMLQVVSRLSSVVRRRPSSSVVRRRPSSSVVLSKVFLYFCSKLRKL